MTGLGCGECADGYTGVTCSHTWTTETSTIMTTVTRATTTESKDSTTLGTGTEDTFPATGQDVQTQKQCRSTQGKTHKWIVTQIKRFVKCVTNKLL